jgi:hypothetical protein
MASPLLDMVRNKTTEPISATRASEGELFKKILGARWRELHPDIRQRFDRNPEPGKPLSYTGVLTELTCSRAGKVWAYLARPFIKGALIPHTDAEFPVDIEVYAKRGDPAIYKQRIYRLNGRDPIQFTSFMREGPRGEVFEYVGGGLGMILVLDVRDGNLHFESDGYFWQLCGMRLPLPALLTPGKTFLCHRNCDSTSFDIRIHIEHPVLGTTFTQAGKFRELRV